MTIRSRALIEKGVCVIEVLVMHTLGISHAPKVKIGNVFERCF